MDNRELRNKILKEYKNAFIFGVPTQHGEWLYYTLLIGNCKKVIKWNYITDEHEDIMTTY